MADAQQGAERQAPGSGAALPEPKQINSTPIIAVGTSIWFVLLVIQLPFYDTLGRHGHRVWLWTCLAGTILGGVGYLMMRRHRALGRTI